MSTKKSIFNMVLSAMFLAIALVLPLLTAQIPEIGNMLCPMHIPVLLCGFLCGQWYGLAVGAIAPILRSFIFGVPPLMPKGVAMSLELATYGLMAGLLYKLLPKKKPFVHVSLIGAMLSGRVIWGCARAILYGVGGYEFGFEAFLSGAFLTAIPGIIIQIIIIPILVIILKRNSLFS